MAEGEDVVVGGCWVWGGCGGGDGGWDCLLVVWGLILGRRGGGGGLSWGGGDVEGGEGAGDGSTLR